VKLPAHPVKTGQARQGLPGNVDMITGSAFLPAPAYGQEGGASSRLARDIKLDDALVEELSYLSPMIPLLMMCPSCCTDP
jgi:hypothetical protein